MKAEFDGLKGSDGEIRLFPESIDDIWHIKHLIRTGDLIFADTFRSLDSQTDKTRPEKTEKKTGTAGPPGGEDRIPPGHHQAENLRSD
jgi:protein pelota